MGVIALAGRAVGLLPRAALALPPRARRRLLLLLALAAVLVAAWFGWFRDSALVAVEDVRISGLSGPQAGRVEAALTAAAERMTTLNVDVAELERAASAFPGVRSISIAADFPNTLAIRVSERRPAALLVTGGRRVPVAGDGTLLPDARGADDLPEIRASAVTSGTRLSDERALVLAAVAGGAPRDLRSRLDVIGYTRDRGIVARVDSGPEVVFGDAGRLRAKWIAAARVLASPSSQGASYIDVRIPERPTAGGLAVESVDPVDPAGAQVTPNGEAGVQPSGTAQGSDPNAAPVAAQPAPEANAGPGGGAVPPG